MRSRLRTAAGQPLLAAIVLCGFALRLWWLFTHTYAIENDGAEYARIAQNVLHGNGYVGLQPGPELLFPPLYPALIAALSPVFGIEHAGRVVSLILGSGLPIPAYLLARRLFGRRTGIAAAAFVAFNPMLIAYSTAVLSETTYLSLQITAAYLLLCAHDRRDLVRAAIAGGCWALAALVRPEAALILGLFSAVAVAIGLVVRAQRPAIKVAIVSLAVCGATFLPYAAWTSYQAGHLQWSGKATVSSFINQRIGDGMSYTVATSSLDPDGRPTGVLLVPNSYIKGNFGSVPMFSAGTQIRFERAGVHQLWWNFGRKAALGAPVLAILAAIGLFGGPWTRRHNTNLLLLVAYGSANAVVFGSIGWFQFRFLLSLLPIFLIFAARGTVRLAEVAAARLKWGTAKLPATTASTALTAVALVVAGAITLNSLPGGNVQGLGARGTTQATAKIVGDWLHDQGRGLAATVMSYSATLAYYSGGVWYPTGYSTSDDAVVAYLERIRPTSLVLTTTATDTYETRWIRDGVPDPHYRPINTFHLNGATTVVYERVN
jgi:4-amino-4-deoxy-L-arabinose transferase-like glycosyltransferase